MENIPFVEDIQEKVVSYVIDSLTESASEIGEDSTVNPKLDKQKSIKVSRFITPEEPILENEERLFTSERLASMQLLQWVKKQNKDHRSKYYDFGKKSILSSGIRGKNFPNFIEKILHKTAGDDTATNAKLKK